jgi:hypothetical protein
MMDLLFVGGGRTDLAISLKPAGKPPPMMSGPP